MIITPRTIEKLKAKDEKAFESVYNEYESLVFYICYSMTGDRSAAEDLTQDVFVKLLTSLDNYQEQGKFRQFLMEIARNVSNSYLTRDLPKRKTTDIGEDNSVEEMSDGEDSQEARMIIELKGILEKDEADIVILKIVYDFKFREIAETLKITIGEAQSRYYKAIEKVKEAYEKGGLAI